MPDHYPWRPLDGSEAVPCLLRIAQRAGHTYVPCDHLHTLHQSVRWYGVPAAECAWLPLGDLAACALATAERERDAADQRAEAAEASAAADQQASVDALGQVEDLKDALTKAQAERGIYLRRAVEAEGKEDSARRALADLQAAIERELTRAGGKRVSMIDWLEDLVDEVLRRREAQSEPPHREHG